LNKSGISGLNGETAKEPIKVCKSSNWIELNVLISHKNTKQAVANKKNRNGSLPVQKFGMIFPQMLWEEFIN